MRVVFLEVDTDSEWAVASIGPAFLAAYLRAHGHAAELVRATMGMTPEAVVSAVEQAQPDLIGVSMTTRQWLRAKALIEAVRQKLNIPVVAGGLHPTFAPEEVLAAPGFDYVCLGEGEAALLELVDTLQAGRSAHGLKNIWVRNGFRPVLREPITPMDLLPFAARDLLDEPNGMAYMTTQRGCPFPCTYCGARMFNELYDGTAEYGRRRTHENVLEELRHLKATSGLNYVIFLDDTFTIHHPWVKEFCKLYGQEFRNVPFSLHARVETVSEPMLHMLGKAGCQQITYGVESGSERVRRDIMRRPVTNQRFRDVFRWTQEAGIMATANYMLGIPGETRDDLQQTYDLAAELDVIDFAYFVFYPYPGTALFRTCLESGYLPADYKQRQANHRESILNLPHITNADIGEYFDRFTELRAARYQKLCGGGEAASDHVYELARRG